MADGFAIATLPFPAPVYDLRDQQETRRAVDTAFQQIALQLAVGGTGVAWASITGKPSTFAPSAHTHIWADITGLPTPAQLGTGAPSGSNFLRGDGTWAVPAAGAHTHDAADTVSGIFAAARLGTAAASSAKYLRGDQQWMVPAFSELSGSIANGQVPAGAVTQHQAALVIGWSQLTGVPAIMTSTGTTGTYAKWASSTTLGNALIRDVGADARMASGYFTFETAGNGLYNSANGAYLAGDTNGWKVQGPSTVAALSMKNTGGSLLGALYGSTSGFGLLDGSSSFRTQHTATISQQYATTHYWTNLAGTETWLQVTGNSMVLRPSTGQQATLVMQSPAAANVGFVYADTTYMALLDAAAGFRVRLSSSINDHFATNHRFYDLAGSTQLATLSASLFNSKVQAQFDSNVYWGNGTTNVGRVVYGGAGLADLQIVQGGGTFRVINAAYALALFTVGEGGGVAVPEGDLTIGQPGTARYVNFGQSAFAQAGGVKWTTTSGSRYLDMSGSSVRFLSLGGTNAVFTIANDGALLVGTGGLFTASAAGAIAAVTGAFSGDVTKRGDTVPRVVVSASTPSGTFQVGDLWITP